MCGEHSKLFFLLRPWATFNLHTGSHPHSPTKTLFLHVSLPSLVALNFPLINTIWEKRHSFPWPPGFPSIIILFLFPTFSRCFSIIPRLYCLTSHSLSLSLLFFLCSVFNPSQELFSSCQPSETSHGRVTKPPLPGGHFFFEALSSLGFWDTKLSWVSSCLIGWTFAVSFAYYSSLPPPSHPQFPTSQYLELQACLWNSSLTLPRWFHGFWNYLHVHDFQIILAALANTLHPRFVSLTAYSSYNHLKIIMANNGSFAVPFQISTSTTLSISVNAITLTQLLKPQTGHTPFIPLYCSHQYPISWPAI